jgi:hypothetical protein
VRPGEMIDEEEGQEEEKGRILVRKLVSGYIFQHQCDISSRWTWTPLLEALCIC